MAPQVTVTPTNATQSDITSRLNLLTARARVTTPRRECEVVAKSVVGNVARGCVYNGSLFVPDRAGEAAVTQAAVTQAALVSQAVNGDALITFTCVPPGNGTRFAATTSDGPGPNIPTRHWVS